MLFRSAPVEARAHRGVVAGVQRVHRIHHRAGEGRTLRPLRSVAAIAPRCSGHALRASRALRAGDTGIYQVFDSVELRAELRGDDVCTVRREVRIVWHGWRGWILGFGVCDD